MTDQSPAYRHSYGEHVKQGIRCRECRNIWPCKDRVLTDLAVTSDLLVTLQTSVQALFRCAGGIGYDKAVMDLRAATNAVTAWAKDWSGETPSNTASQPPEEGSA